jgi:hypothetical protein
MALGLLKLPTNDPRRPFSYKQVPADKALRYYQILHNLIEPTPEEAERAMYIVDVKLPPSYRPDGYKALDSPYEGDRTKAIAVRQLADPKAPGPELFHEGRG